MKSKSEIEKRLRNLRIKYAKRYIAESQVRSHQNCIYNKIHVSTNHKQVSESADLALYPKRQTTLVIIQPDAPIRLCMYGSDNPSKWSGDICDSDDISKSCPMFKPGTSASQAREDFLAMLSDDEWVFDNYRDMAALQWVLNDRLHKMKLSILERIIFWFHSVILRRKRPSRRLPTDSLPEDLWVSDAPSSTTGP